MSIVPRFVGRSALILALLLVPTLVGAGSFIRRDLWWPRGTVSGLARQGETLYLGGTFRDFALIVGSYALLDPETGHFRSMLVEGQQQADSTYAPQSVVSCLAPDGAGGWYLGGRIVGRSVAHLLTDHTFAAWDPQIPTGTEIYDMVLSGSTLYVSGNFRDVQGKPRAGLVAVNTSSGHVTPWDPQVYGPVYDMLLDGDRMYLAGLFSYVRGQPRMNLASVNPTTSAVDGWHPDASATVRSLYSSPEGIFVAGDFTTISGVANPRVALVDPDSGSVLPWSADLRSFRWNPNGGDTLDFVRSITCTSDQVFIAGKGNVLALDRASGQQLWDYQTDSSVGSLESDGSSSRLATRVYFSTGQRITCVDGQTGSLLWGTAHVDAGTTYPSGAQLVPILRLTNGDLFVIGAGSLLRECNAHVAALNLSTGEPLPLPWYTDGHVRRLLLSGQRLYLAGDFTHVGASARGRAAAIDLTTQTLAPWNPNADETVRCMELGPDGQIFLGGEFWTVGGLPRTYLAAVDSVTGDVLPWRADADDWVMSMAHKDDTLYVGGWFTSLAGTPRNRLGALRTFDGGLRSWNPSSDAPVFALRASHLGILAGGDFHSVGGAAREGLAALDPVLGLATAWAPSAYPRSIRTIDVAGDRVFLGEAYYPLVEVVSGNGTLEPDWRPSELDAMSLGALGQGRGFWGIEVIWADADAVYAGGVGGLIAIMDMSVLDAPKTDTPFTGIHLERNRPNPVHDRTTIRFSLSRTSAPRLVLFDVQGRVVRRLLEGRTLEPGAHEVTLERHELAAGLYWYRLEVNGQVESKRMVVLE